MEYISARTKRVGSKASTASPNRYNSIDGLRAISCISIIAMHIQYNTEYQITGFLYQSFVPELTWLVYLFLMISGFGMCAGYLEQFLDSTAGKAGLSLESFYKKRYRKILPFFGFLLIIALILEPSLTNFYEASVEMTLLYGLLPNNTMNVLGVCWTLGVIFLFYLIFPAFTVLMKNKIRAWVGLLISLWINFVCQKYFFSEMFVTKMFAPRHSFIYCLPLFIAGGIVYLYRIEIREICKKFRLGILIICAVLTCSYFFLSSEMSTGVKYYILISIFMFWLSYAVGVDSKFLSCGVMKYLSGISMEMYLAQMVIFRLVEKCGMLYVAGTGWVGFLITYMLTVFGLIVFIECYKNMVKIVRWIWGNLMGCKCIL